MAPIYLKKEKRVRKEWPLMKKKIIRIGTKRKPKLTKKERCLTGDIQTKVGLILYGSSPSGIGTGQIPVKWAAKMRVMRWFQ